MQFNAIGEYDYPPTKAKAERLLTALGDYSPVVATTDTGRTEVTITFDADLLLVAASVGASLLISRGGEIVAFQVMATEEFDRRTDTVSSAETVTTVEAAEMLGITRQRVQQLIDSGQLPSEKVGRDRRIPVTAIDARRERVSARQEVVASKS